MFQVGVKNLVVYINKADAVDDPEVLELVSYMYIILCSHYLGHCKTMQTTAVKETSGLQCTATQ